MLLSFSDLSESENYDVCIVGSGPAGMTCAMYLADRGKRILLIEGGDNEYTQVSQEVYAGKTIGDPYFDLRESRLRQLGGSSGHWAGWCRELDDCDFNVKCANPDTKWPITRADLAPFRETARSLLDLPPSKPDVPLPNSDFTEIHFNYSPVRFGDKFADTVNKEPLIFCALRTNLVEISTDGQRVTGLTVSDFEGRKKVVRGKNYVLACGGIENSRILLWNNQKSNGALIKDATVLGKRWMEHPEFMIGEALLSKFNFKFDERGIVRFAPNAEFMARERTFGCSIEFYQLPYEGTKRILADVICLAPTYGKRLIEILDRPIICGARVRAAWEQEPRLDNSIVLGGDVDQFGIPRVELHWSKSPTDMKTVRVTAQKLAETMAAEDIGRMSILPWVLGAEDPPVHDERAGHHHMGGTRMSNDPSKGIVDKNCKVFGQENLYIGGSSVFPSTGFANPTLTIVQLAQRLGDKLATVDL